LTVDRFVAESFQLRDFFPGSLKRFLSDVQNPSLFFFFCPFSPEIGPRVDCKPRGIEPNLVYYVFPGFFFDKFLSCPVFSHHPADKFELPFPRLVIPLTCSHLRLFSHFPPTRSGFGPPSMAPPHSPCREFVFREKK